MDVLTFIVRFMWFYSRFMNSSLLLHLISITILYIVLLNLSFLSTNLISLYSDFLVTIELVTCFHLKLLLILVFIIMLIFSSFDKSDKRIVFIMFITFLSFSFLIECSWTSIHRHHMHVIYLSLILNNRHRQHWHRDDNDAVWK